MRYEDAAVGQKRDLGTYTFGEDEMIGFAKKYDPQAYHLDAEAAKQSVFGGLIASGWLTTAVFMKLMVAACADDGGLVASPGFEQLKWHKPLRPGTTLAYSTEVIDKRELKSRPGFGLVTNRNEARDADGALYMSMITRAIVAKTGAPS
jgi:acyl dehydratase